LLPLCFALKSGTALRFETWLCGRSKWPFITLGFDLPARVERRAGRDQYPSHVVRRSAY
jgi:hypothetical protein